MDAFYEWITMINEPDFRIFPAVDLSFGSHMHRQYEIVYITHGEIKVSVNAEKKTIGKGEFCVILSNDVHSYSSERDSQGFVMIFSANVAPDFANCFRQMQPANRFIDTRENKEDFSQYFTAIMDSYLHKENNMILSGHIFILLGKIIDMLQLYKNKSPESDSIQRVLNYLEQNYEKNISLEFVAREIGVSRFHISRLFNNRIGCSFNHYLNCLRISRARRLLATDKNITDISFECGFESTRTFYRAFKEICGITPRQLRTEIMDRVGIRH